MATVSLIDVKKSFGPTDVIHGISTDIADGEFIVIVGPSGCGKSTLLRMVAGLESVSAGEVKIGGERANDKEPMDRDIAMVFQNYALYPHMSVRQNMGYGLKIARLPKDQINAKVTDAAKLLQLEPLLDRKPKQLSGGQRQRVAMGRAIVREPAVFLFDEPLSNLDAKLRVQMRTEIRELHQRLSTTTVYVTHDQIEAMTMADKIVVMQAGYIEQIGSPLELYDAPANRFVASFIGSPSMNLLSGVVHHDDGLWVDVGGIRLPVPADPNLTQGRKVTFGVRPEHLELSDTGLPVTVSVIEPTGSETHVMTKFHGQEVVAVFRDRHQFKPSQQIHLNPMAGRCYIFDEDTGMRIA